MKQVMDVNYCREPVLLYIHMSVKRKMHGNTVANYDKTYICKFTRKYSASNINITREIKY